MSYLIPALIGCALLIFGTVIYYGDNFKNGYRPSTEFLDALERIDCKEGKMTKCPSYLQ
ncbi:TMhelix containing protein [Caenorhabditis elegans]|uniref:TMhelix containing protein n=1 Tax=Caenorhabditis elegans TaxID=6239 RepID=C1P653_CAEEL|nr:TMhelix containing protein [Caenorhabditis elegans]CAX65052.1 TMhelix containing protein [Caenorhabditis elegans]|eukprot:NP_001255936.1 Uncharacterized protein CELE_C49C3.20 [Caenorhabditis elegans]